MSCLSVLQLKWPFRGDITIQLLNQSSDEGHQQWTVDFGDKVDDSVAGRVVGREPQKARAMNYS